MPIDPIKEHFDLLASSYDAWKTKASHYYDLLTDIYRERISPGVSVLEVGCGTGTLLARMQPARGVGIDISSKMIEIAARKYPNIEFHAEDIATFHFRGTFDFIMVPDVVEHLRDIAGAFASLRNLCEKGTTLMVTCVNPLWAPVMHLAERMGWKMPEGDHRWLSKKTIVAVAASEGFLLEDHYGRILLPKKVPVLSSILNGLSRRFRFLSPICLIHVYLFVPNLSQGANRTRRG
jgi:SAM-dependent methyltransferase